MGIDDSGGPATINLRSDTPGSFGIRTNICFPPGTYNPIRIDPDFDIGRTISNIVENKVTGRLSEIREKVSLAETLLRVAAKVAVAIVVQMKLNIKTVFRLVS